MSNPRSERAARFVPVLVGLAIGVGGAFAALNLHAPRSASTRQIQSLRASAIVIRTDAPRSGAADLIALKNLIGDATVVGLGEGTHGTREFVRMRHRLIEFLVEEMGFRVVTIEAGMKECEELNRYVLTGEGNPGATLRGLSYWLWSTEEMLDLVGWMRHYNQVHDAGLQLRGMDMPEDITTWQTLAEFFNFHDPEFADSAVALSNEIMSARQEISYSSADSRAVYRAAMAARALDQRLRSRLPEYRKSATEDELAQAEIAARQLLQSSLAAGRSSTMQGFEWRDRCMGENAQWHLSRSPRGTKMIVLAHNGHVDRTGWYFTPVGRHLADQFGARYISVGLTAGRGQYSGVDAYEIGPGELFPPERGSLEHALQATGIPMFALDLRSARSGDSPLSWLRGNWLFRHVGAMTYGNGFYPSPVTDMFDVLIYIDSTSRTKMIGG